MLLMYVILFFFLPFGVGKKKVEDLGCSIYNVFPHHTPTSVNTNDFYEYQKFI